MEISIRGALEQRYVIPLYQRYLAWGEEQINQLLQDIYESYKRNRDSNYFIGSLVLLQREDGCFEVIDGQQRLTVLTILAKLFEPSRTQAKLAFDSRPEVADYLAWLYSNSATETPDNIPGNYTHVARWAETTELDGGRLSLNDVLADLDFVSYFFDNVYLVRIEMPQDTDVARYFEIMNNRGQQLQKHEILKARLLENIDENIRGAFARLWDASFQMNRYIQYLFDPDERCRLFGADYERIYPVETYGQSIRQWNGSGKSGPKMTLDEILEADIPLSGLKTAEEEDEDRNQYAILDFPNFLMHVLKLCYGDPYKEITGYELPLNEKYLLDVADVLKGQIDAENFILTLFRYRIIFDRYIVQQKVRGEGEDAFEWVLRKPKRSEIKEKSEKLYYVRTFDNDTERIIKALSMLQVTFRTRIYKRWLQNVLSWFSKTNDMNAGQYLSKLNKLILEEYDNLKLAIEPDSPYAEGTHTPHLLFNFIDYLYYYRSVSAPQNDQELTRFEFRYRNSVEHHRPVSRPEDAAEVIDCLGNLCLVNKSVNSRMNNEDPVSKANFHWPDDLPPKRRVMYCMTQQCLKWNKKQILDHYRDLVRLLDERHDLLTVNKPENS